MKLLLVAEYREGKLVESTYELLGFAERFGGEASMVLVGSDSQVPEYGGRLYLADAGKYGEYNPDLHKKLILQAIEKEGPDYVVFMHSSYGWDLAPRVSAGLGLCQVSGIIGLRNGEFEVGCCNGKMRRTIRPTNGKAVLTIQAGAFPAMRPGGAPQVQHLDVDGTGSVGFVGYEPGGLKDVDLARAKVVVAAGRGIGKKENMIVIAALARALGGEVGVSRPVVDAGWAEHSQQIGTTGQTVSPRLYIACGISGAIQHVAGMKKSDFVVAINKDKDAPISEVADVFVVADVMKFIPALTASLQRDEAVSPAKEIAHL